MRKNKTGCIHKPRISKFNPLRLLSLFSLWNFNWITKHSQFAFRAQLLSLWISFSIKCSLHLCVVLWSQQTQMYRLMVFAFHSQHSQRVSTCGEQVSTTVKLQLVYSCKKPRLRQFLICTIGICEYKYMGCTNDPVLFLMRVFSDHTVYKSWCVHVWM